MGWSWCYHKGYYQIPKIKFHNNNQWRKKNTFSYGEWFENYEKPLNRIKRQVKIKQFLDQFY